MKTMNEFLIGLLEDIPVGIKNEELWLDYLRNNFKNPKQLFVTFVSVDKVGLNPKSQYDTPIGVYTYPLEYVFDEEDVPFRGDDSEKSSKIKVLKQLSNKVLSNDLGDSEYQSKIKQGRNISHHFLSVSLINSRFLRKPSSYLPFSSTSPHLLPTCVIHYPK